MAGLARRAGDAVGAQLAGAFRERIRELTALQAAARTLQDERKDAAEVLAEIAALLPAASQYPEIAAARARFGDVERATASFRETDCRLRAEFTTSFGERGAVDVVYLAPWPSDRPRPFLAAERARLDSIAEMLRSYFERKKAHEALRRAERRYRALVEQIPAVVYVARPDANSSIIYASPQIERILGVPGAEWSGDRDAWLTALHPDDRDRVLREVRENRTTGRPFRSEYRMVARDGRVVWVRDEAVMVTDDGTPVLEGVMLDITDRKEAERALAESERRYRLLAENITDVISIFDMDLRLTYVSPSVVRLRGFTAAEVMAQTMDQRLTPASCDRALRALAEELEREQSGEVDPARSWTIDVEMYRKDGSTVWTETRMSFLRDEAGRPAGLVGVNRDISERRRLEQLKSDFVALTTHQLRTPLGGIRWLLEVAVEAPELSDQTRSYIDGARESADRLSDMVNCLLDAAQLESATLRLEPQVADLGELTRSVLDEMGRAFEAKGLRVSMTGSEAVTPLMVDRRWLRQAILNLVSNAVKYTPPAGEIAIRMGQDEHSVRWEVRDSGIGIPQEAHSHLFEKFYRAPNATSIAPEGTGLGLYLTRLIVERFGGRVWCESEIGRGAVFVFTLPREP